MEVADCIRKSFERLFCKSWEVEGHEFCRLGLIEIIYAFLLGFLISWCLGFVSV